MDEPTTGLHASDVQRLIVMLDALVERGDTVIVIEHQPDLIAAADYVLDLGPEGGALGGRIVASGTPEDILAAKDSYTGRTLRSLYGEPKASKLAPTRARQPSRR
jgi:excinuclease ABC subunit A